MIMEKLRRGVKVMMIRDLTGGNGGRRRLGRARNEEESASRDYDQGRVKRGDALPSFLVPAHVQGLSCTNASTHRSLLCTLHERA